MSANPHLTCQHLSDQGVIPWSDRTMSFVNCPVRLLSVLYTPLFSRTVIFAVLARCGNSRVVNFAILLMLSLL